jgi:nucleoside-diphosphate-sugar epimerase
MSVPDLSVPLGTESENAMRVFVTGASGWIGSATVDELLSRGHDVVGLARSDASAASIEAKGATVRRGDLDTLDELRAGALDAHAVVHLANKHDWSNPAESNRAERAAVQTFVDALAGTDKPFLLASGVAGFQFGRPVTEEDRTDFRGPEAPRGGTENLALDAAEQGLRAVSVRFAPTVHGSGDHGFIPLIVEAARRRGVSGYIGDGGNRWSAVHRSDAAALVALALEQAPGGSAVHAVAEEGIATREIAEAIGHALGLPTVSVDPADAVEHFGFIGRFFGIDMSGSSEATRRRLGWDPTGPTLLQDLESGAYTAS